MEHEKTRINIAFLARIILVVIIALIVGLAVFTYFRLHIGGNDALRQAKNVRMSLRAADIEMYGKGKSIYNPGRKNGIEEGVEEKAETIYKPEGKYIITSYDAKKHELTGMVYEIGNYIVTFKMKDSNISWDVDYRLNIYSYDETSDIVNGDK